MTVYLTTVLAQICLYFVNFYLTLLFCATILEVTFKNSFFTFSHLCPDDEIQRRKIWKVIPKKK